MSGRRYVTVIVQGEGELSRATYRMPRWLLRLLVGAAAALVVGLLLVAALYAPLVRAALRVPTLERQVERLEGENARIRELAAALDSVQARYDQVRRMIGGDVIPALAQVAAPLRVAPAVHARVAGAPPLPTGPTAPFHWPLDEPGYVTRGMVASGGTEEEHAGLDIAAVVGTPVRAAGGGRVADVDDDPEYGLVVTLEHPDDYRTTYGHLSRVIVRAGEAVAAGEVIGLSGNTGRSSAPHLHFEVRRGDEQVDPSTLVSQEE